MGFKRLAFLSLIAMLVLSFSVTQIAIASPLPNQAKINSSSHQPACPSPAAAGNSRCYAWTSPFATSSPTGLSPTTIKTVYSFSTSMTVGAGKTIAIVDAYNDPTAESDLGVFSAQFGLPACTTASSTGSMACSDDSFFSKMRM